MSQDDCVVHLPGALDDGLTVTPVVTFEVLGLPAPQGSKRIVPLGGRAGGRPILIEDNDPAKRAWRQAVAVEAKLESRKLFGRNVTVPLEGPVVVGVEFRFPRPASDPRRRYPHTRPDVDKLTRALLDSLKGILLVDDSQVVRLYVGKSFGEPGAVITIGQLEARLPREARTPRTIPARQESLL